ncbi:MAG: rhomboid family intramembrane serine protease [Planctomycetaceae bacterium]|nr:MAG: rhomboid family intramembrane serine protease [Planctomycetaceae bacterium]
MRQIGTLPQQVLAERFTAFLITRGIAATAEEDGQAWLIWVRDEDDLEAAQQALREFLQNPEDHRYQGVIREAAERLQEETRQREQTRRRQVTMSEKWRRGQSGNVPLVRAVIGMCIAVFLLLNFGGPRSTVYRTLAFCDPVHVQSEDWNENRAADRAIDIRRGEIWRLATPAFMHMDLIHLVFNMIWFYMFGSQIERRQGPMRLVLLVLVIAVLSNAAQGLAPTDWGQMSGTHRFLGLSGVVYGLLGYLWIKTTQDPASGLFVSGSTVAFLIIWLLLGVTGILAGFGMPIANMAHVAGLLVGLGLGYLL